MNPRIIRHLCVTSLACVFLMATIGCGTSVSVKRSPAEQPAQVNRPGPPAHAPAHGYRRKFEYHYYPDAAAYYAPDRGTYFWLEADNWRVGVELPDSIRVKLGEHVTIELDADSPYEHHKKHAKSHPGKKPKRANKHNHGQSPDRAAQVFE